MKNREEVLILEVTRKRITGKSTLVFSYFPFLPVVSFECIGGLNHLSDTIRVLEVSR